jgi:hypothetical protein
MVFINIKHDIVYDRGIQLLQYRFLVQNQDFDSRNSKLRWKGTGKERGNTTDAEKEAEPATEKPLRLLRLRTMHCGA